MKSAFATLGLIGLLALPAIASPGGISGHVIDLHTGQAIEGVPVFIYRVPVNDGDKPVSAMKTDKHGGFADVGLPLGRYLVATRVGSRSSGCTVDDVFDGFMSHITVAVGKGETACEGPHTASALVNPALTSDTYFITSSGGP
jgi:5-hydroxyisourate hydrolase-like protein (transthyretin family)